MKKILIIPIIFLLIASPIVLIHAEYALEVGIPGYVAEGTPVNLVDYIRYIYLFSLGVVGLAAFGAMVYGGSLYMASGAKPALQGEAKEWFKGAIGGLILALASFLILSTINPNLVKLEAPKLPEVQTPASPASPTYFWEEKTSCQGIVLLGAQNKRYYCAANNFCSLAEKPSTGDPCCCSIRNR